MKHVYSAIALSFCAIIVGNAALANETKNGLVICYGVHTSIDHIGKVAGTSLAYDDFRGLPNEYGLSPSILSLPSAEWGAMLSAGVVDGILFYDRDVAIGGKFETGVSGTPLAERYGSAVGGCRFVAEMPTCAHQKNDNWTVSCADANAVEREGLEGSSF